VEFRLESEFYVFALGFDSIRKLLLYQHMARILDLDWHVASVLDGHMDPYVAYVVSWDLGREYADLPNHQHMARILDLDWHVASVLDGHMDRYVAYVVGWDLELAYADLPNLHLDAVCANYRVLSKLSLLQHILLPWLRFTLVEACN
jgi:hypothetical protein